MVGGVGRIVTVGRGAGGPGPRGLAGVCVGVTVGRVVALRRKGRGPAAGGPTAVLAAVVGMGGLGAWHWVVLGDPGAWHWVVPPGSGHLLLPSLLLLGGVAPGHPAGGGDCYRACQQNCFTCFFHCAVLFPTNFVSMCELLCLRYRVRRKIWRVK